jgi:nucleotide-binding universal stress UspA family protein
MIRMKNILVPVDFSTASEEAVRYGISLASQFDARLVTAHVIPSFQAINYAFPDDPNDFTKKALDESRGRLAEQIPTQFREKLNWVSIVKSGEIREELLGIIDDESIDFVVMGTHGKRSLERFFLGSTTESLLRTVRVPILTVSPRAPENQNVPAIAFPRKMVYATDLSEAAGAGLHYSIEMARTYKVDLALLHVTGLWKGSAFDSKADIRGILLQQLWKGVDKECCTDIPITAKIVDGVPHREILRFAEDAHADLIVLNVQSKGLLERAMLGSTAEHVIRSSKIPVLSIPRSTADRFAFVANGGIACSFANA